MEIRPFKAYRYNKEAVGDIGSCISPPYDVIDEAQQQKLYDKNEYNIVRIIYGKESPEDTEDNNKYTRAAGYLNEWIKKEILKQDRKDGMYAYLQSYEAMGKTYQRFTLIAEGKMEPFGKTVRPHEHTLSDPIADRLKLNTVTSAKFGLVFMLYDDPECVADKIIEKNIQAEPEVDFTDENNVRHSLFVISDDSDIEQIRKMMADKSVVIADGHHRYTTGLKYAEQNPKAKYQMLAFANICNEGLIVLATHRAIMGLDNFDSAKLLKELEEEFEVIEFKFNNDSEKQQAKQKMLSGMKEAFEKASAAFGIYTGGDSFYLALLKDRSAMDTVVKDKSAAWKSLDVAVLHKLIMEKHLGLDEKQLAAGKNVQYIKDTSTAIDDLIADVDSKHKQAAFFMNPPRLERIEQVADEGEKMPQKSTYFYPKLYTGFTIDKF